jgi:hypothetical protein
MRFPTIRVAHRVVVDWVAHTFHLPEDTARFHAEARARAAARARTRPLPGIPSPPASTR